MNTTQQAKINLLQYIFIIHGIQLGIGLITLPGEMAKIAGTDGWIAIILGGVISIIASVIIILLMKKYPNGTIIDLVAHYFGNWARKLAAIIFVGYFALITAVTLIHVILFIQLWILPFTNIYILFLLMMIPMFMLVSHDVHILGRYAVFVFFMSFWLVLIYLMPLKYANFLHLLPIIKEGWAPVLEAVEKAIYSYLGFEIALFLYPYLDKKEYAMRGVIIANILSILAFTIVTIIVFTFYSPDEITIFSEPALTILKVIELKFIERLEIIFFSFYLFIISTTIIPYLFFTVYCTKRLFLKKFHRLHVFIFFAFTFIYIVYIPPTFFQNMTVKNFAEKTGFVIGFFFSIVLWLIVTVLDLKKQRSLPK